MTLSTDMIMPKGEKPIASHEYKVVSLEATHTQTTNMASAGCVYIFITIIIREKEAANLSWGRTCEGLEREKEEGK